MSENNTPPSMLGAMLRIPFQAIVERIDQGLRERGYDDLRPAHFVIFQQLPPGGLNITELAERAQITKQSMGALVGYVESRGYLELVTDPNDRRARLVRLTPKGRQLEQAARQIVAQTEAEWAEWIGSQRMQALKETLQALTEVIQEG